MSGNENHRESGATKYPARTGADPSDGFSQEAAGNKKPKTGVGLTRPVNEVDDYAPVRRSEPSRTGGAERHGSAMNIGPYNDQT